MPTPFMHLVIAGAMANEPGLHQQLSETLRENLPAFRLGHTAPDAQTMSGQTREATHFFTVPMGDSPPAHCRLFDSHSDLARPRRLDPARAAFLTGYLCHLALDQLWIGQIFEPIFGERAAWGSFRDRLYLHNVLRTLLDQGDLPRLHQGVGDSLAAAVPCGWLPFLADQHLVQWRDLLCGQLQPGASARTIEIFARRMNRDPQELASLLNSPDDLDRLIFSRVSRETLETFRAEGLARSLTLAAEYWEN